MRCMYSISVAVVMLIVLGCSGSGDLEKAKQDAKAAMAEVEKLRAEFELAKLKAEKELAEAKAKQAEAEAKAAASEADADTSKAALGFIGMRDLPAVSQPDPKWTPQELLAAYFNASSWSHREPLVKDYERVEPLIKSHYRSTLLKPMAFEVLQLTPESTDVGSTLTATIKLATGKSDYVIIRTKEGYRIDWEANSKKWLAAKDARFREAHGLVDATIEAKLVKKEESAGSTRLTFEFTNRSNAHLSSATITVTAFGANGQYLQKSSCHLNDLPPRESTFESITLIDVAPSDLRTWKLNVSLVSIRTSSGDTEYVGKYFELKEIDGKASNSPKKDKADPGNTSEIKGSRDAAIKDFQKKVAEHLSKAAKDGQTPDIKAEALALQRERNELLNKHFTKGPGVYVAKHGDLKLQHRSPEPSKSANSSYASSDGDPKLEQDINKFLIGSEEFLKRTQGRVLTDKEIINAKFSISIGRLFLDWRSSKFSDTKRLMIIAQIDRLTALIEKATGQPNPQSMIRVIDIRQKLLSSLDGAYALAVIAKNDSDGERVTFSLRAVDKAGTTLETERITGIIPKGETRTLSSLCNMSLPEFKRIDRWEIQYIDSSDSRNPGITATNVRVQLLGKPVSEGAVTCFVTANVTNKSDTEELVLILSGFDKDGFKVLGGKWFTVRIPVGRTRPISGEFPAKSSTCRSIKDWKIHALGD